MPIVKPGEIKPWCDDCGSFGVCMCDIFREIDQESNSEKNEEE